MGLYVFQFGQLFHERPFLLGEVFGDVHADVDQQIACAVGVHAGQAFAPQAEHLAGLRAGRDGHFHLAVHGGHFHRVAQDGGGHGKQQVVHQVVSVTYQFRVFFLFNQHEQVAVHASPAGGVSLAAHAQLHTLHDTGGDVDGDDFLTAHDAFAVAVRAFVFDYRAVAAAGGAVRGGLHGTEDGLLHACHPPAAVAGVAGYGVRSLGRTRAAAFGAGHVLFHLDFLFHAFGHFGQGELYFDPQVRPPAHAWSAAASPAEPAEAAKSAYVAEYVAEVGEYVFHCHAAAESASGSTAYARMAELVVALPFLRVAQHLVGFGGFLELFFRRLVARVLVRVVLNGFFAVGFLDFLGCGRLADLEHFVVISF